MAVQTPGRNRGGRGADLLGHLGGSLEESGVEVEDVSGVGLSTGGSSEEERHLSVGDSLLGQVIVDDASVLSVVSEPLSHSASREGGEVLERGGLRGSGGDDDATDTRERGTRSASGKRRGRGKGGCYSRVLHGVVLLEGLDELGDGGSLLSDGDVDTVLNKEGKGDDVGSAGCLGILEWPLSPHVPIRADGGDSRASCSRPVRRSIASG